MASYLVTYGVYKQGKVVEAHSPTQAVSDIARTELRVEDFLHPLHVFSLTPEGKYKVDSKIDVQPV